MSEPTNKEANTDTDKQELLFGVDSKAFQPEEREWYQDNLDIVVPAIIIAAGLFQFILRKWILPVSEDVISKLEDQFSTQGLIYNPGFGVALMIIGTALLVLINVYKLF